MNNIYIIFICYICKVTKVKLALYYVNTNSFTKFDVNIFKITEKSVENSI